MEDCVTEVIIENQSLLVYSRRKKILFFLSLLVNKQLLYLITSRMASCKINVYTCDILLYSWSCHTEHAPSQFYIQHWLMEPSGKRLGLNLAIGHSSIQDNKGTTVTDNRYTMNKLP